MKRLLILTISAVVAVAALTGIAAGAGYATHPTKVSTHKTKLGKVLSKSNGVTLYLFEKDKNGKSACSGACAKNWPPLLTKGKPQAVAGVKSAKLGTTKRADGTTQVTYAGHPLYTFILDGNKPGATKGEGIDAFGAEWYVLGTNGKKIEKSGS